VFMRVGGILQGRLLGRVCLPLQSALWHAGHDPQAVTRRDRHKASAFAVAARVWCMCL